MEIPKDLKKVIKEKKRLESDLNLTQTIYETLKLIGDEYGRGGNYSPYRDPKEPKSWRYKTISVEDFECASKDSNMYCRYSFDHNKNHYSATMESNPSYTHIYVQKSNNLTVFAARIEHETLFRQVEVTGFLPEGEWYTTLLARLEAFTKEVYPIIRAENKKMCDEFEREHIKNLKERFIGK